MNLYTYVFINYFPFSVLMHRIFLRRGKAKATNHHPPLNSFPFCLLVSSHVCWILNEVEIILYYFTIYVRMLILVQKHLKMAYLYGNALSFWITLDWMPTRRFQKYSISVKWAIKVSPTIPGGMFSSGDTHFWSGSEWLWYDVVPPFFTTTNVIFGLKTNVMEGSATTNFSLKCDNPSLASPLRQPRP